jgi:hypothetical protein
VRKAVWSEKSSVECGVRKAVWSVELEKQCGVWSEKSSEKAVRKAEVEDVFVFQLHTPHFTLHTSHSTLYLERARSNDE